MAEERLTDYMGDGPGKVATMIEQAVEDASTTDLIVIFLELLEARCQKAERHLMRSMAKGQERKSVSMKISFRMKTITDRLSELDSILGTVMDMERLPERPEQPRKRNPAIRRRS